MANHLMIQAINAQQTINNPRTVTVSTQETSATSNVTLRTEHAASLKETEKHKRKVQTIRNYNHRINKMINWIKESYYEHYAIMTRPLSDEEKAQGDEFYQASHDFVYNKLDLTIIKAFIASHKIKTVDVEGRLIFYGWDHLRKYSDAIQFGNKRGNDQLPEGWNIKMKEFLDSLKKENQQKKKSGQVEENESDPITMPFYMTIVKWCVTRGYILLWLFTVLQWNCMARSNNIDGLTWNCFSLGKDSIIIKYFDTKKDQTGEKCTPKNCYANPFNFMICICTALGCYLSIFDNKFQHGKDTIFLNQGVQKGNASHAYCSSLADLFKEMGDLIYQWVRPGHAKDHGIRKGSAMEVTSGTTCPPPASAVAQRGEWSLGKIFDIYWLFAEAGDHYCGCILAGLDAMSTDFDILPPHFMVGLENEMLKKALKMNFKYIFKLGEKEQYENIHSLLLRAFASVVYHSDALIEIASKRPSHPFYNIPVLNDPTMLSALKLLVTTEPSHVINAPSGIPPHVPLMKKVSNLEKMFLEEREERKKMTETLVSTVEKAIEKNALTNGNITYSSVTSILRQQQKEYDEKLDQLVDNNNKNMNLLIQAVRGNSHVHSVDPIFQEKMGVNDNSERQKRWMHTYNGKMWHVPSNFAFPNNPCFLEVGWSLWLKGMPNFHGADGSLAPIMPFRRMDAKFLPMPLNQKYKNEWKPIFSLMEASPNLPPEIKSNADMITQEIIEASYCTAIEHLKTSVCSYVFLNEKFKKHTDWSVGYWSKMVKRSSIIKHGTDSDIRNLPVETHLNRKRKRNNNTHGA